MCIRTYTCTHTHPHTHKHTRTHTHTHTETHTHTDTHTHTHTETDTRRHMQTHTHTQRHAQTRTRTDMYIYIYIYSFLWAAGPVPALSSVAKASPWRRALRTFGRKARPGYCGHCQGFTTWQHCCPGLQDAGFGALLGAGTNPAEAQQAQDAQKIVGGIPMITNITWPHTSDTAMSYAPMESYSANASKRCWNSAKLLHYSAHLLSPVCGTLMMGERLFCGHVCSLTIS